MRDRRAVVFVDGNITAVIDGQAGFFEGQAIDGRAAARGEEGGIGFKDFAALHGQAHTTGRIFSFDGAFVKQEMHAKSGKAVAETIGNLVVEKWEKTVASVHEGDINAEGFEDGSVFATDDAAADDGQAFGNAVHLKKSVRVKSVDVVEGNLRGAMGLGPRGDEDDITL